MAFALHQGTVEKLLYYFVDFFYIRFKKFETFIYLFCFKR
jgi:hypothetical protein